MDVVREVFSEFDIRELEVEAGGIRKRVDDELIEALDGCEALLLRPGMVNRTVLERTPDLRVVALTGSGYDNVDVGAATEHGVAVIHTPENPGPSVAEHTIGMSIYLLRGYPEKVQQIRQGNWDEVRERVTGLGQSTVGVAGLGTIGFEVARLASQEFGSDVVGYDPYVTGEETSSMYPRWSREEVEDIDVDIVDDFLELCRRSDIVTLHVPLTSDTRGLVGTTELDAISDGILINTSRGGVVDEGALVDALESGTFTGKAALDVLVDEPPEPDDPLLGFDSVYITPHVAGVTDRPQKKSIGRTAEKIRTALDGRLPDTVVNPEAFE
jgi:D-3-phosphoglycerate dehydrogenase